MSLLSLVLSCLSPGAAVHAQVETASLRRGESAERTIARGHTDSFNVGLEKGQLLQLVVEQHGVDLVVRVYAPDATSLGQFDSPNGTDGPERVALVAGASGSYRIDVSPLEEGEGAAVGRYEIKILDLRPATAEERESVNKAETARAKGLALLSETAGNLRLIRLPENRVRLQMQAAQLLWDTDEKLARELVEEAAGGVREYLANVDPGGDQNYYQSYQTAMQLRNEVLTPLTQRDPEMALSFLRSTRTLTDPNAEQGGGAQQNQELQLELSIANQIAAKDSKRALQVAQESLKKGYAYNLLDMLGRLQTTDHEAAVRLAGEIARKLQKEDLLKNQEAANAAAQLLRMYGPPGSAEQTQTEGDSTSRTEGESTLRMPPSPLSDQEYRDLLNKALTAALSYSSSAASDSSPERVTAQNLLNSLVYMTEQMEKYAPGRAAAVEKRAKELNTASDPQSRFWQKQQDLFGNGSVDAILAAAARAPREFRSQFYNQAMQKAAGAGDFARARQILTDHTSNPFQRQQALRDLDQQAIQYALGQGKLEEVLRLVGNLPTAKERARMLVQIVNEMGPTQKRAAMVELLEQARAMMAVSGRAEDQEQMDALFELASVYAKFEPGRGFDILEPIVAQYNEMSEAAVALDGFGQQFFQDGELLTYNGNVLAANGNQLASVLGALAASDFDRAKTIADGIKRMEVRLSVYLAIAQNTINQNPGERAALFIRRR